jgi:crossover junction endodeoxyribonuclease RuvC
VRGKASPAPGKAFPAPGKASVPPERVAAGPGKAAAAAARARAVRIIGIDPGSLHTGYGVVEVAGPGVRACAYGRISPPPSLPFPERLRLILEGLSGLIGEFCPEAGALENVFTNRNPMSALKLAQARGVAMAALASAGVPVFEYAPALVKRAVCGTGRAGKEQVAYMAAQALGIRGGAPPDATDALACALCHAGQADVRSLGAGIPQASASRARGSSWRRLTPADLEAMGFRVKGGG